MRFSPLLKSHRRSGAVLEERRGYLHPTRFTSANEEYEAAIKNGIVVDRCMVGRLMYRGQDFTDLLERLSTNKIDPLSVGKGVSTVLTTNKGRILDVVSVTALEDGYLLMTGASMERRVMEWIEGFTFREDVSSEDLTRKTALIGVMGPKATRLLRNLSGITVADMNLWDNKKLFLKNTEVIAVRSDPLGFRGYELLVPERKARGIWRALTMRGMRYGIAPLGLEAWDMLRVRYGIGEAGREFTEAYNPLEAGLKGLISFNKGCYVRQEVVARLNTYDKVQRAMVWLAFEGSVEVGSPVLSDGREVGTVTSVATLPGENQWTALAYLRKGLLQGGSEVMVIQDGCLASARILSTQ